MNKKSLMYVFGAILLGIIAGAITSSDAQIVQLYGLIGRLFLNALSLVVLPLVAASIITGTARMASDGSFKEIGMKTMGYFLGTTSLAVLIGFFTVTFLQPGVGQEPLASLSSSVTDQNAFDAISNILLQIIPSNIVAAASKGQIISVITFSIFFGIMIPSIDKKLGDTVLSFWQGTLDIMLKITRLVISILPIGVFGLVAKVVAETGVESLQRSGWFCLSTILGLAIYAFIALPLLLKFVIKTNPWKHIQAMGPAMLTAFVTTSSAATIPVTMECLEKRAGVSNKIASLIPPLGCSLNMSGSALYIIMAVITIAQAYGINLSWSATSIAIFMSILFATGMAGIPSASVVSVVLILETLHIPTEGIGIALVVDRILDMCRTPVTVLGNSVCAKGVEERSSSELPQHASLQKHEA